MPANQFNLQSPWVQRNGTHILHMEGGQPQYNNIYGKIAIMETMGPASTMIHVGCNKPTGYQPVHMFALEIKS